MIYRYYLGAIVVFFTTSVGELRSAASEITCNTYPAKWQQVDGNFGLTLGLEREVYEPLDHMGRFVIAVQAGKDRNIANLQTQWSMVHNGAVVSSGTGSLAEGMWVVDFALFGLTPGKYDIAASVWDGALEVDKAGRSYEVRADSLSPPKTRGRIPLIFPKGVPATPSNYSLTFGVPLPKGALTDLSAVRIVDAKGQEIPAQFTPRAQWSYDPTAGIRWLGVDIQVPEVAAWWPERKDIPYFLEFGAKAGNLAPKQALKIEQVAEGIRINTGPLQMLVRASGFNVLDQVFLNGKLVLNQAGRGGAYLVDQEGYIYRAANDKTPKIVIEETGPLRAVIRVEGWYVKDGTDGAKKDFRLPSDALCKFVTRLEVYAGQPYVRVLHTWINTSDSFNVSFRDVGLALLRPGNAEAVFGVEGEAAVHANVDPGGVYLLQHLPDAFAVFRLGGEELHSGKRSNGTVDVLDPKTGWLAVSHRETWERFPKEIEVRPDELRFHVWPEHGRNHDEIDPYSIKRYHQLWFAHQGQNLDLRFPWKSFLAVIRHADRPDTGVYAPGGTAMGGVHSSAMGTAITSDFLIRFGSPDAFESSTADTAAFQVRPSAGADPAWISASQVLGPIHPYDPERFPEMEKSAENAIIGIWNLQDATGEFGMFLYRGWHHSAYLGDGYWHPYRLYSAGHHYESYLPWLYFARSGNPEYAKIGMASMRHLTDLGIIHYDNPQYEHTEFGSGQKRLVGSTRHTNGFVLWGGDHAILSHLTSYGGILLAHYLTGDLRFRDVILEWSGTLLDDRSNPQWEKAATMNWGINVPPDINRDNNNALGEMLDLYQLTFDPRLLAFIQPCIDSMQQNMFPWALELPNILSFRRTPVLRSQLLEAANARMTNPKGDKNLALGFRPDARLALAAHLEPTQGFEIEALKAFNVPLTWEFAQSFNNYGKPSIAACNIPDRFLGMPLVLSAIKGLFKPLDGFKVALSGTRLPVLPMSGDPTPMRMILREVVDQDLEIRLRGLINSQDAILKIVDSAGKVLHEGAVPPGADYSLKILKDGVVGEYAVFLRVKDGSDMVFAPISNVPQEVYAPISPYFAATEQDYFMGAPNRPDGTITFEPGNNSFSIQTVDRKQTLIERKLADTERPVTIAFPEGGVWLSIGGRYFENKSGTSTILAIDPDRFFVPGKAVMELR